MGDHEGHEVATEDAGDEEDHGEVVVEDLTCGKYVG